MFTDIIKEREPSEASSTVHRKLAWTDDFLAVGTTLLQLNVEVSVRSTIHRVTQVEDDWRPQHCAIVEVAEKTRDAPGQRQR